MVEQQTAMPFGFEVDASAPDSDSYCTPHEVWDLVFQVWPAGFHLDPMSNQHALHKGSVASWTIEDDAMVRNWQVTESRVPQRTWLNPPYSNPRPALQRLASSWFSNTVGSASMALVKVDPSTRWWADCAQTCTCFALLAFRVAFRLGGEQGTPANFASALFYWGPAASVFRRVFHQPRVGWVYPGERKVPPWPTETWAPPLP